MAGHDKASGRHRRQIMPFVLQRISQLTPQGKRTMGLWETREPFFRNLTNSQMAHINFDADRPTKLTFSAALFGIS